MWTSPNCARARAATLLVGLMIVSGFVARVAAEDLVVIRSGKEGRGRTRLVGTIVDYNGERLRIIRNGREDSIDSAKVVRVRTTHGPKYQEAEKRFAARAFASAQELYRQAAREEQRQWVSRMILVRLTQCYHNLGEPLMACATFRVVYNSDKTTPRLDAMPLAWRARADVDARFQREAETWIDQDDNAAAQLMAASWLLSTAARGKAQTRLKELTSHADRRLALLAEAQLWRTKVVTADDAEIQKWRSVNQRIPSDLRAGPYFVIGRALARRKHAEQAALALMRVPILFPDNGPLASQSLLAAGRELETIDQPEEARRAYREVITNFAGSLVEQEARQRLAMLQTRLRASP